MKITTIDDVLLYNLKSINENNGNLIPLEGLKDIPFEIKRVFYVYNVKDDNVRGKHAHLLTEQLLICFNGKCKVVCNDGNNKKEFILDSPEKALYIPNMIWDEQIYYDNAILLVLSNSLYDKNDYIRDFKKFIELKKSLK